jgi:hypothetical protein
VEGQLTASGGGGGVKTEWQAVVATLQWDQAGSGEGDWCLPSWAVLLLAEAGRAKKNRQSDGGEGGSELVRAPGASRSAASSPLSQIARTPRKSSTPPSPVSLPSPPSFSEPAPEAQHQTPGKHITNPLYSAFPLERPASAPAPRHKTMGRPSKAKAAEVTKPADAAMEQRVIDVEAFTRVRDSVSFECRLFVSPICPLVRAICRFLFRPGIFAPTRPRPAHGSHPHPRAFPQSLKKRPNTGVIPQTRHLAKTPRLRTSTSTPHVITLRSNTESTQSQP